MTPVRIIVVDDDPKIRSLIRRALEPEGYEIDEAGDEAELSDLMGRQSYDLITLDLNLPGSDGLEIARRLRRVCDTPIIMVTGKSDVIDRVVGLEIGADDYIAKPFHVRELLARVRTVLRRRAPAAPPAAAASVAAEPVTSEAYEVGGMTLVPDQHLLLGPDGNAIDLTHGEFGILSALVRSQGRALSREMLIDARGGDDGDAFDRAIDSTIARLRKKLPQGIISTVREVGYKVGVPVKPLDAASRTGRPGGS